MCFISFATGVSDGWHAESLHGKGVAFCNSDGSCILTWLRYDKNRILGEEVDGGDKLPNAKCDRKMALQRRATVTMLFSVDGLMFSNYFT